MLMEMELPIIEQDQELYQAQEWLWEEEDMDMVDMDIKL